MAKTDNSLGGQSIPRSRKLLHKVYAGIQPNGLAANRLDVDQEGLELD